MTSVIRVPIPSRCGKITNRYPECPHAGDAVLCTGPVLVEDHLCIYPGTPATITCGERNIHGACPMDYPFSDDYLKQMKKEKKSKDKYQASKRSRK